MPLRCRRHLPCFENPADRRCADPVAELEQLTPDRLVSPAMVPGGEAPDQRGDLGTDQRPAGPARVGLLLSGQVTVPPRGTVPGVTSRCARSLLSRSAISAASTARPAQSSRGRAWCGAARRSRAAAPAGPRLQAPANGRAGPASHRAERRSGRAGEKTPLIIMPHGHALPVAPGHRNRPTLGTRQAARRYGPAPVPASRARTSPTVRSWLLGSGSGRWAWIW